MIFSKLQGILQFWILEIIIYTINQILYVLGNVLVGIYDASEYGMRSATYEVIKDQQY